MTHSFARSLAIGCALGALLCGSTALAQRGHRRPPRHPTPPPPTTTAATPEPTPAPPPDPFADQQATPPAPAPAPTPAPAPAAATSTSTSTSSTPPPPAASPPADVGPTPPDLSPLRSDYSTLMDDMVSARQLVATLGEELFQTRVTITVQDRAGDDQTLATFALELDGAPVFHTDGEIEGGGDGRQVYEGALAPGPHVLTVASEQRAREDAEYRYVQRDTYRFIVVRDRRTEIGIVLEDDSDIARQFAHDGEGRYDVRTRVRVATRMLTTP